MGNYFRQGADDARRGTFYAESLPCGTRANSETRATYRAGWITERARRGKENLPAYFAEIAGRYYWIVSVAHDGRPIYNSTNGEEPKTRAGYYNLAALMKLKGDKFGSF